MPAPILRRYAAGPTVANTDTTLVPAVPAARALVVSKVVVSNYSAVTVKFILFVAGAGIASGVTLAPGDNYTESGLVVLAGETMVVRSSHGEAIICSVFGEEVDN